MLKYFEIKNWSSLGRGENASEEFFLLQKRNILLSQVLVIGVIASIFQFVFDLQNKIFTTSLIDAILGVTLAFIYWLNESGKHKAAKYAFILFSSTALFIYAAIVHKKTGTYLIFFPIIGLVFMLFEYEAKMEKYLFLTYVIALLLILEFTNFHPFGDISIGVDNVRASFILNLLTSVLSLVLGINFMLKINYTAEKNLMNKTVELQGMANEINEKNEELEKTNDALDRFVYSTSHDLRSPLKSIMGLVNVAQYDVKDKVQKEYLDMISDRIKSLDEFIEEIIDYSRNSRMEVVREKVDVLTLIKKSVQNFEYLENAQNVRIDIQVNARTKFISDEARLRVVLNNVIANAIKYHNTEIEEPIIKISVNQENGFTIFSVKDNGIGIDMDKQEHIYDMFYRGTEGSSGSGLGLYIVKETIEKLGGIIELTSTPGEGSEFVIKLPNLA